MLKKYLLCFLVSMVPLIELRAGVPLAISLGMTVCAGLVMALYNLPWIRYGLLVLLLAAAIWKRKMLLGLLRTIKNKT